MRSVGKTPSRQDLAGFFKAVHQLRPLPTAGPVDPLEMELSTRLPSIVAPVPLEDITVHPRQDSLFSWQETLRH